MLKKNAEAIQKINYRFLRSLLENEQFRNSKAKKWLTDSIRSTLGCTFLNFRSIFQLKLKKSTTLAPKKYRTSTSLPSRIFTKQPNNQSVF